MYLTKREQMLVSMLRIRPRTGAELADILAVSRRTVVREVASVNAKLEAERAGHIESGQRYRLEVGSEDCLRALLSDELSDEQAILLHVLTAPDQSFTSLSQATYLSRRALAKAISSINHEYEGVVHLEPRAGRGVEVALPSWDAADVLASLAAESPYLVTRLEGLADWERTERLVRESGARYREEMRPFLSSRQVRLQTIAAMASAPLSVGETDNRALSRLRAAEDLYHRKHLLLFDLVTHRQQIVDQIADLLRAYGIHSTRSDLCALVFDHVTRCALFPTIMSAETRLQMHELRLAHPFEFDFGDDLCTHLRKCDSRIVVEPDFLALYVLASMERPERRPVSVLVLSNRRSMSTINQRLIEQNVDKVDVRVVCDDVSARTALGEREWDLAVRDEDYPTAIEGVSWDMAFRGVLDASELKLIRTMALDILYRKNVARMLDEDGYFHLHNKPGRVHLTVLEDVLGRLVDAHRITSAEADLIRERERAGKRLNVKGIAFPHAITPVESDEFRLFVACLDEPVTDMDATIGLIIVVLASQSQADKSSIFTYLLSVIEDAAARSEPLPRTYEETLRYLGSV